jgi:hypothetical protein
MTRFATTDAVNEYLVTSAKSWNTYRESENHGG